MRGSMRFSARRWAVIGAMSASVLVVGVGPGIAQSVDAGSRTAIGVGTRGGMLHPAASRQRWDATAENSEGRLFTASDRRKARAKKLALQGCRSSSLTHDPKSCHVTGVRRGDGGVLVNPSAG